VTLNHFVTVRSAFEAHEVSAAISFVATFLSRGAAEYSK
jgi:hypothetical protein